MWIGEEKKICAVGVHLRRFVSSHGIGLNVSTEVGWFGRIEACGLGDKGTTSLALKGVRVEGGVEEVGRVFVKTIAEGLRGIEGVREMTEDEVG